MNSGKFFFKTPCEINSILAVKGACLASESTFYKVLKEARIDSPQRADEEVAEAFDVNTHYKRAKV